MVDIFEDAPSLVINYLSYMQNIKGKSEKTIKEYYYDLRTFFRFIKCKRKLAQFSDFENVSISDVDLDLIKSITMDDIYDYMFYVAKDRKNSSHTRARKSSCIKSFFLFLTTKAKVLDVDPTKELESPKIPKTLPKYLTLEESMRLLEAVDGEFKVRDYAIITLFLNCGLRLSELVGINLSSIKDDRLYIKGKGNKERTIYLNEACQNAINEYLKERPHEGVKDKDALFLSKRKSRITTKMVQVIVKKALARANLDTTKYSTHKLRHTAATLMYQYGDVDVRTLQKILGHEQLTTTQIYTHVSDTQIKDATSKNPLANFKKKD